MRPTKTQVSGFTFDKLPTAAGGATTIGDQIEADGLNIQRTITGMDWSGAFRNAAVQFTVFKRCGISEKPRPNLANMCAIR
ncbi:hypothetical protein [Williamsia sp.]|uniref:hypothetical protein n=1 Tax=Williamsia sp. TaxID=1872085 RepID=UPI002F921021